ncbi:MAG: phasin family protein [Minwuia sp.]|uniref:phasin family protein n=1 Tax=Minwuia sp. TaxID=2493630 RepID=UPI003A84380D
MTKIENPFADFTKAFGDMKMPMFDFEAVTAFQKKNFEAMTAANQLAMDGLRAVFERQVQIAQNSVEEAQIAIKALAEGSAKVDVEEQTAAAKDAMEKAAAHIRELSEMAAKSQNEVFDVLNKRMLDGMEEVKGQFKLN